MSRPYIWTATTVSDIVKKPEYMGHTVNFRTRKEPYKDKHSVHNSPEDWIIFENTQEAIVDEIEISTVIDGINLCCSDECYLFAYQKIRDELLKLGYGLQCNGSRINAIQSGMMAHYEKIYLVEMGKQALSNQIVCIWDYAEMDFFPDTKMQLEFADKWYECKKE